MHTIVISTVFQLMFYCVCSGVNVYHLLAYVAVSYHRVELFELVYIWKENMAHLRLTVMFENQFSIQDVSEKHPGPVQNVEIRLHK